MLESEELSMAFKVAVSFYFSPFNSTLVYKTQKAVDCCYYVEFKNLSLRQSNLLFDNR